MPDIEIAISEADLGKPGVPEALTKFLDVWAESMRPQPSAQRRRPKGRPQAQVAVPLASIEAVTREAFNAYKEGLPESSQRFLELLEQRGQLTVTQAVDLLGLDHAKAMGGLTGSMRRWAPSKGVPVPFDAIEIDGKRAWRWRPGCISD